MNNDARHDDTAAPNESVVDTEQLTRLLDHPAVRARVADVLREEFATQGTAVKLRRRLGPLLASVSSALLMLFPFFIPSLQDQWNRWQSHRVIQRHVATIHWMTTPRS